LTFDDMYRRVKARCRHPGATPVELGA